MQTNSRKLQDGVAAPLSELLKGRRRSLLWFALTSGQLCHALLRIYYLPIAS
jgi:hypothetical protein